MALTFFQRMLGRSPRSLLGYAGALATRGIEVAGKFGLYLLAARLMGGHNSGLFFLCLTWINLASAIARLGLERAMSRHIPAELAIGDAKAARCVITSGLTWIALASLAAAGITLVIAQPAATWLFHEPELAMPLRLAALVLPPQSLAFAFGFILIGLGRGVAGQMVQSALPPVLSLIALVAGLSDVSLLLTAYAASYTACCIVGLGILAHDWRGKLVPGETAATARAEPLPSLAVTARPFLVIEVVQSVLLSLPVLVLGAFADATEVSAFSIASRMTMMINTILVSLAMIGAPAFARHHRLQEFSDLRRADRQTRMLAMAVCLPIIAVIMVFPRSLLSLLGTEFVASAAALEVLSFGQIVNTLLPTEDMMLAMTGHGASLRRLNLQQLLVCVVLCATLIPAFTLMGAAVVSTICLIQGRVSFALTVRRAIPQLFTSYRDSAIA